MIVTILGWLFILRGVFNLVFPGTVQTLGDRMIASHAGVLAGAAATIALGSILSIMGYEDLWNTLRAGRARRRYPPPQSAAHGARRNSA